MPEKSEYVMDIQLDPKITLCFFIATHNDQKLINCNALLTFIKLLNKSFFYNWHV